MEKSDGCFFFLYPSSQYHFWFARKKPVTVEIRMSGTTMIAMVRWIRYLDAAFKLSDDLLS